MQSKADTWALVLAAGEGTRLRALTTVASGAAIPKQFWALHSGPSLLGEALLRARSVAEAPRVCAIVAAEHADWWRPQLRSLAGRNIIVQPRNRGTAIGVLLPLLHLLERDAEARVVLLPSDHHVRDEGVLATALREAVGQLSGRTAPVPRGEQALLLGFVPQEPDAELGYIVPSADDGYGALRVAQFVEKPPQAQARALIGRGALWNAFILAATARGLLGLFERRVPAIVDDLRAAVRRDQGADAPAGAVVGAATRRLYERLPELDFSRDILGGQEPYLRALAVPACGWSDLGTPRRIAEVLRRAPRASARENRAPGWAEVLPALSLAAQHARLQALSQAGAGC